MTTTPTAHYRRTRTHHVRAGTDRTNRRRRRRARHLSCSTATPRQQIYAHRPRNSPIATMPTGTPMTIELLDHAPTLESDSVRALVWLHGTETLLHQTRASTSSTEWPPSTPTRTARRRLGHNHFRTRRRLHRVRRRNIFRNRRSQFFHHAQPGPVLSRGITLAAPPPPPAPRNDPSAPPPPALPRPTWTSNSSESTAMASPYESQRHNNTGTDESPSPRRSTTTAASVERYER